MDKLNILHWVIFYNRTKILEYMCNELTNVEKDFFLHLGRAFTGDHEAYEYTYTTALGEQKSIRVTKLGIAIIILS